MTYQQITLSYAGDRPSDEQLNRLLDFMDKLVGFTIVTHQPIDEQSYRRHAVQAISVLGLEIERNEQNDGS